MLKIRFNRVGKKNKAQFRIVVQENAVAPGGRHIEVLGSYDPHLKKNLLKVERIKYWMEKGAVASDTVYNLLVKKGIIKGKKKKIKIKDSKKEEKKPEKQ